MTSPPSSPRFPPKDPSESLSGPRALRGRRDESAPACRSSCAVLRVEKKPDGRYVVHVRDDVDEPDCNGCRGLSSLAHKTGGRDVFTHNDGDHSGQRPACKARLDPQVTTVVEFRRALPRAWTPEAAVQLCRVSRSTLRDWQTLGFIGPDASGLYSFRLLLAVRVAVLLREQQATPGATIAMVRFVLCDRVRRWPRRLLYCDGEVALRYDERRHSPPELIVELGDIVAALLRRCRKSNLR